MLRQSSSGTEAIETTGARTAPTLARYQFIELSPGVYTFAPGGMPAGSLVSDGHGGYTPTIGDLSGTGIAAATGGSVRIF